MAKLNFPDPSASPFNADNGVIYVWVDQGGGKGYWSGSAELTSENLDAVFVEVNGDNMTGNLSLGGASNLLLDASLGKILSQSTADNDPARTLVTKDYIDNNVLSDDFLSLKVDAGDQFVLSTGDTSFTGDVGIGTTDPQAKLEVRGTTDTPSLTFGDSGMAIVGDTGVQLAIGRVTSTPFSVYLQGRGSNDVARNIALAPVGGNVGIGTDNPTRNLEVKTGTGIAGFKQSSSSLATTLEFLRNGAETSTNNAIEISSTGGLEASINYAGGAYFSGLVGIGTDAPQAKLDVMSAGDGAAVLQLSTDRPWVFKQDGTGSSTGLRLETTSGSKPFTIGGPLGEETARFFVKEGTDVNESRVILLPNGGNVGIGTDNPTNLLHILESSNSASDKANLKIEAFRPKIRFQDRSTNQNSAEISGDNALIFSVSQPVDDNTSLAEHMRITADGYVGIGTSAPTSMLTVEGSKNADPTASRDPVSDIYIQNVGGTAGLNNYGASIGFSRIDTGRRGAMIAEVQPTTSSGQGALAFFTKGSTTVSNDVVQERVRINHNGAVGIGTKEPDGLLDINGKATVKDNLIIKRGTVAPALIFDNYSYAGGTSSIGSFNSGSMIFSTNASEKLRITEGGEVGIGTDNPDRLLFVDGTISAGKPVDGEELLRLRTERAWSFYQKGTSAATQLELRCSSNKPLVITGRVDDGEGTVTYPTTMFVGTGNNRVVGINTESPQATFDVNGTIKATSIELAGSSSALDDYEEGTWTPTLTDATAYTFQNGHYTKVGNCVYFSCQLQASAATATNAALSISGLPYPSVSGANVPYGGAFRTFGGIADQTTNGLPNLNYLIVANNTIISFKNGQANIPTNNPNITLTDQVIFNGFYFTND